MLLVDWLCLVYVFAFRLVWWVDLWVCRLGLFSFAFRWGLWFNRYCFVFLLDLYLLLFSFCLFCLLDLLWVYNLGVLVACFDCGFILLVCWLDYCSGDVFWSLFSFVSDGWFYFDVWWWCLCYVSLFVFSLLMIGWCWFKCYLLGASLVWVLLCFVYTYGLICLSWV